MQLVTAAMRRPALAAALGLVVAAPVALGQEGEPTATTPTRNAQVDIQIAVDTTGSMGPSIAQARRDAVEVVTNTRKRLPGARFAVVEIKDAGDDPEYAVRQPMTGDADAVEAAIKKLSADGGGDAPEGFNLAFSRAVDDPAIGYREGSRRILFVIADAEPHGAADAELPGCKDESEDPHGLRTNDVLSLVRRARITGNFILQASSASTTLRCYRSLAGLTYGGGEAIVSRSGKRSAGLGELIERAIGAGLPSVSAPSVAAPANATTRAVLRLTNRVPEDVRLSALELTLPEGVDYRDGSTRGVTRENPERDGRTLTWTPDRTIPATRRRDFVIGLRTGARAAEHDIPVEATFVMPDGGLLRSRATLELEVRS